MLGDAVAPVSALHTADQSGEFIATGAYLAAGRATAGTTRCLLDAIDASNGHPAISAHPSARLPAGVCYPLRSGSGAAEIRAAENLLLRSLRKITDGIFAYWFDRKISTAISRYLVRTRVTPNQISVFTVVPALLGAVLLAAPGRLLSGLGAILYLISTILDGCDGEVARLKYLESAKGARLDLLCDNIGLVALFLGIIVHAYFEVPGPQLLYAGGAVVGGLVAAQVIGYLLIARPRIRRGGGDGPLTPAEVKRRELYERLASRDFAYLLPVLAFTGTLSWLVWATALGVNLFWIALVAIVVRKPAMNRT
jgi:phosphatidylglycerophosphate synthase